MNYTMRESRQVFGFVNTNGSRTMAKAAIPPTGKDSMSISTFLPPSKHVLMGDLADCHCGNVTRR